MHTNFHTSSDKYVPTLVSIIVPTYQSGLFIEEFVGRVLAIFVDRKERLELILVNDASPDNTWEKLLLLHRKYPDKLKIISLFRNSGQHNAILCGLHHASGDIVMTMDDDLQHPPEEIPALLEKLADGYDLVIGAYEIKKHSGIRNRGGEIIDRVIRHIYNLPTSLMLTSFRAMQGKVAKMAKNSNNPYPYITCMLLDQAKLVVNVPVRHEERKIGNSSYSVFRSLVLATNLLFSYSSLPLYLGAIFCAFASLTALAMLMWVIAQLLVQQIAVPGWASVMILLSVFSTFILASQFVIGVYIARIHHQLTGRRVPFIIDEMHD